MKHQIAALASIVAFTVAVCPSEAVSAANQCEPVKASYYCCEHHGRRTASGEIFDENALTAAMPSRRHLGERWRVSRGDKSVDVRINDFGPHASLGRAIDLSKAAFVALAGSTAPGVISVCLEKL